MKIGLLQLNSTIGAFEQNRQKLITAYQKAVRQGAEFVIAPELFLCGYPPRDLLLRPDFLEANLNALNQTAASVGNVPLCVGFVDKNPNRPGKPLFNAAAVLQNGNVVWRINKSLLPTYDVFDEDRYFEPAKNTLPFEFNGRKIGITVCEDIWNDEDFWPERLYRRDPVKELITQGADIILNISASPWHLGKNRVRHAMLASLAAKTRRPLLYCNLVGGNDELVFDGGSLTFDAQGRLLARGAAFAEDFLLIDLPHAAPIESTPLPDEEKLHRALVLGLRDYLHKCGFKSAVLGLSGGIDSAVVACLAAAAPHCQIKIRANRPTARMRRRPGKSCFRPSAWQSASCRRATHPARRRERSWPGARCSRRPWCSRSA